MHLPNCQPRLIRAVQLFVAATIIMTAGCSSNSYLYSESPLNVVRDVYGNPVLNSDRHSARDMVAAITVDEVR